MASVARFIIAVVAAITLGGASSRGDDRVVVRDEWTARWAEGRKVSWTHVVIEHDPRAGHTEVAYVVSVCTTAIVDSDDRLTWTTHTTTDPTGRVLTRRVTEEAPWGRTAQDVAPVGSRLGWRRQIRELPPQEGSIDKPLVDALVLKLLLSRADAAEVTTEAFLLRGPLSVEVLSKRVSVSRAPDGTTTLRVDDELEEVRAADDRLRPWRDERRVVGPTTAARAADLEVPAPGVDQEAAIDTVVGVSLRSPGPEWIVRTRGRDDLELGAIDVVHPSMTWASVLVEDGRMLGSTPEDRRRFVTAIRRRFGEAALADPVVCTHQGRQGFTFPVRLVVRGVELTGDLVVVDVGTARATLWVIQPTDLQARRPDDRRRALESLHLVDVERTWQRVSLGRLSAEVPAHWSEATLGHFQSWSLGSWLRLCREPLGDRTPATIAERVVEAQRLPDAEEVQEVSAVGDLDGRMGLTLIERSAVTMAEGVQVVRRVGVRVVDVGDGLCEAVVVCSYENEVSAAEVQRMLASARWGR